MRVLPRSHVHYKQTSDAIENCDGGDCETVVVCRRIRRSWLEGVGRKEDRLGIGWARGGGDRKVQSGCLAAEEEERRNK